jgi:hypothetical protein
VGRVAVKRLLDGLLDRHRPAFHPRRQTCSIAERSARKFQRLLQPGLLGGRERSAQSLAKRGRGPCQVQRLLGVRLRRGTYGETFERPRDAALVTQSWNILMLSPYSRRASALLP